jgi:hypothetical protein
MTKSDAQRFHELTGLYLPENPNAADILNRMKEFCEEERYIEFMLSFTSFTDSRGYTTYMSPITFVNNYILNPSALLRKAVEFLVGETA